MKVADCRRCERFTVKNRISFRVNRKKKVIRRDFLYGYCTLHGKRCLNVRKCRLEEVRGGQIEI